MNHTWLSGALLLLLVGCSSTGHEIGFGIDRDLDAGGSMKLVDTFSDSHDEAALLFNHEPEPVTTIRVWYAWHFDAKPLQPVYLPAALPPPTDPPVVTISDDPAPVAGEDSSNIKAFGADIPKDTDPILVFALAAVVFAAGLFGWNKVKKGKGASC